jgi:hypothetical protein
MLGIQAKTHVLAAALHPLHGEAWQSLVDAVRTYSPDIVVLVARKMPRLVEALNLTLGDDAICVSDHAIPFVHRDLTNARVAVVDDIWNIGTTMLRARDRVLLAQPKEVRLFALAAKNAGTALEAGVNLSLPRSLPAERHRVLVDAVPRALRCVAKPYDVDFPIVPCALRAPFSSWQDCWQWLSDKFGDFVHSTVDDTQVAAGVARASINLPRIGGWTIKARLYFDFKAASCNFVPMALAPSLSLANDYPPDSFSAALFEAVMKCLDGGPTLAADLDAENRDGIARVNTFCDSVLISDALLEQCSGLFHKDSLVPFSLKDFGTQFGPTAQKNCEGLIEREFRPLSYSELETHLGSDRRPIPDPSEYLIGNGSIVDRAKGYLTCGLSRLALDALIQDLARCVGADDPAAYALSKPYTSDEIRESPYLRLRIGFTYEELTALFRKHYLDLWHSLQSPELMVSDLLDVFIDHGAIVPTFTLTKDACTRVYRKGEANPRWDDEITRLLFTIKSMAEPERKELLEQGRTRIAKINAILALSGAFETSLTAGAFERGNVGLLVNSVVEREGAELTGLMRRFGLLR